MTAFRFHLSAVLVFLVLLGASAAATEDPRLSFEGSFVQGGLVIARTEPFALVEVDGRPTRLSEEGLFLIGFGRDAGPEVEIKVKFGDGGILRRRLDVAEREFAVQRIDGLPPKQVTPDPKTLERIRAESALIKEARALESARTDFMKGFAWPVHGTITGVFGSQRILNGEPRAPHSGVDIAAPTGTPVLAAADGVVTLVHEDMFYTGKTIMLDHGHGLASIYVHLSEIEVAEGQRVEQGTAIGKVGATGRATGAHLHWGVSLNQTRLDPELLAGPMQKPEAR